MLKSYIVSRRVLFRNLLSNWGGLAADLMVAFFLTPFIVSSLGMVTYGIWSLVNSVIGYLGLIDMGIRGSVGRYINHYMARDDAERVNEVISTSLFFLTLMCLIVFGISYLIAFNFDSLFSKTPRDLLGVLRIVLPLMAFNLWLTFVSSIYRSVIAALDRFEVLNAVSIFVLGLRTAGVVLVLRLGHGLLGLAIVATVANVVSGIVFMISASRLYTELHSSLEHVNRERFSEMWKFGIASFVTRIASQFVYESGSIITMILLGPTMVAVYSIGTMLVQYGQNVMEQIGGTLFPSIMKAGSVRDISGLQHIFVLYGRLAFFFGVLVYMGFVVFGRHFIELWVGPSFRQAAVVLAILSVSELLSHLGRIGGSILFSLDKIRYNVVCSVCEVGANILLTVIFVGVFHLGIKGIALGVLVPRVGVLGFAYSLYTAKVLAMSYRDYIVRTGGKAALVTIVSFILFSLLLKQMIITGWKSFFIQITIAAIAYFPIAAFLMFKREDLIQSLKKAGSILRLSVASLHVKD